MSNSLYCTLAALAFTEEEDDAEGVTALEEPMRTISTYGACVVRTCVR